MSVQLKSVENKYREYDKDCIKLQLVAAEKDSNSPKNYTRISAESMENNRSPPKKLIRRANRRFKQQKRTLKESKQYLASEQ